MWKTLALWMILLFISSEGNSASKKRVKRILGGELYTSSKHTGYNYEMLTYYATIATQHDRPWIAEWLLLKPTFIRQGYWGEVYCGGALITEEIISTACHCLSNWEHNRQKFGIVARPRVEDNWEGKKVAYIGATSRFFADPEDEKRPFIDIKPIPSVQFILHPACGYVELDPNPRSYDYGWIRVDPKWTIPHNGVPLKIVRFAPVSNILHNTLVMKHVQSRQKTCIQIGFGWYREGQPYTSTRLRVGYGQTAPLLKCMHATADNIPKKHRPGLMNWFCAISEQWGSVSKGDSGGPVVCDGMLTGVVSGHLKYNYYDTRLQRTISKYWSLHSSIARNHFGMSVEFRKFFIEWIRTQYLRWWTQFYVYLCTPFYIPYPESTKKRQLFSESQSKRFITLELKARDSKNTSSGGRYPVDGTPSSGFQMTSSAGSSLVAGTVLALVRHFTP